MPGLGDSGAHEAWASLFTGFRGILERLPLPEPGGVVAGQLPKGFRMTSPDAKREQGFRVWGSGFRVWGEGVQDLGFRAPSWLNR